MKLRNLITTFTITCILACTPACATEVKLYDSADLTLEVLQSRAENHDIIIEQVIGVVLDEEGNGKIINAKDGYGDYISYRHTDGARKGDTILSLCIYNPDTGYDDDVIERCDFIIDSAN